MTAIDWVVLIAVCLLSAGIIGLVLGAIFLRPDTEPEEGQNTDESP